MARRGRIELLLITCALGVLSVVLTALLCSIWSGRVSGRAVLGNAMSLWPPMHTYGSTPLYGSASGYGRAEHITNFDPLGRAGGPRGWSAPAKDEGVELELGTIAPTTLTALPRGPGPPSWTLTSRALAAAREQDAAGIMPTVRGFSEIAVGAPFPCFTRLVKQPISPPPTMDNHLRVDRSKPFWVSSASLGPGVLPVEYGVMPRFVVLNWIVWTTFWACVLTPLREFAGALRRARLARLGRCVCGYDLTGVAGRCPECGARVRERRS